MGLSNEELDTEIKPAFADAMDEIAKIRLDIIVVFINGLPVRYERL
jgi:hypothetical protein